MALLGGYLVLATLATLSCLAAAGAQLCVWWVSRRNSTQSRTALEPLVSILKPLKGVDASLAENLESFCRQDYPDLELIVGAADPEDPALDVARAVRRKFPRARLRIVSGERAGGANPKVRNLANLCDYAQGQIVVVSDSNVRVPSGYVSEIVAILGEPKLGLVTHLIAGADARGLGGLCESARLLGFVAGGVALAEVVGSHPCVVGKSMAFRRSALRDIGGFEAFAMVLAEDYLMGKAVADAGYGVRTARLTIDTPCPSWTVREFVARHVRWCMLRRSLSVTAFAFEILLLPLPWAASALLWGNFQGRSRVSLAFVGASLGVWLAAYGFNAFRRHGASRALVTLMAMPIEQTLGLLIWAQGWFISQVSWRGRDYRVTAGTRLVAMQPSNVAVALRQAA